MDRKGLLVEISANRLTVHVCIGMERRWQGGWGEFGEMDDSSIQLMHVETKGSHLFMSLEIQAERTLRSSRLTARRCWKKSFSSLRQRSAKTPPIIVTR